jgi:hypothetical protein
MNPLYDRQRLDGASPNPAAGTTEYRSGEWIALGIPHDRSRAQGARA